MSRNTHGHEHMHAYKLNTTHNYEYPYNAYQEFDNYASV